MTSRHFIYEPGQRISSEGVRPHRARANQGGVVANGDTSDAHVNTLMIARSPSRSPSWYRERRRRRPLKNNFDVKPAGVTDANAPIFAAQAMMAASMQPTLPLVGAAPVVVSWRVLSHRIEALKK